MTSNIMGRLTVPIVSLSVVLLITAGGAAWYVHRIQTNYSAVFANEVASVHAAQELEISIREVQAQFDRYLISRDRRHLEALPRLKTRTEAALLEAERLAATPTEQQLMNRVRMGHEHFFQRYEEIALHQQGIEMHGRVAELINAVLDEEILDPTHEYLRLNEGMAMQLTHRNEELSDQMSAGLIALALCGASGGLFGGWALAGAVRRSLQETEANLKSTAARLTEAVPAVPSTGNAWREITDSVTSVLQRLEQSERNALRAEQLARVGQMAAGIAHEIRNPLMAIKLVVQAAEDPGRANRLGPRDFVVLKEEIARLEDIAAMFLDFARPTRPNPRPVAVASLVEQAVDRIRGRADRQGVRVEIEQSHPSAHVEADPNQLRQVLYNLLFNAIESQPGGGWIRVHVAVRQSELDTGAEEVRVSVEDRGNGLPAHLGEQIFEPFVSTKDTGLGLGLSICRRIVEVHGGRIYARDRAEGGAVFTACLPLFGSNPQDSHSWNSNGKAARC